MTTTTKIKDQAKRIAQIEMLEAIIKQHSAAIEVQELTLRNMVHKQINRLAELRMQKLLLTNAQRAAPKPAATAEQNRCGKEMWEAGRARTCVLAEGHAGEHCFP